MGQPGRLEIQVRVAIWSLKSAGQDGRWKTQAEFLCCSLDTEFLLPQETSVFALRPQTSLYAQANSIAAPVSKQLGPLGTLIHLTNRYLGPTSVLCASFCTRCHRNGCELDTALASSPDVKLPGLMHSYNRQCYSSQSGSDIQGPPPTC